MSEKKQLSKKETISTLIFMGFIFLGMGMCYNYVCNTTVKHEPHKDEDTLRKERIEKAFSAWDGAHINLEKWVKESINDPDSYDHVETRFREASGDSVFIIMTFRAKNAFGGVVKNTVTCWTDLDGNIISVPKTL